MNANFQQITDTIMMVRPAAFDLNEQAGESNAFQARKREESAKAIHLQALEEFDVFVTKLKAIGIQVIVVNDLVEPQTSDAIFPNNWVSFHQNGTVFLYPMQLSIRRLERRLDIFDLLKQQHGFQVNKRIDFFQNREDKAEFLEGTGSMILDRQNKVVYACFSPRTHPKALQDWAVENDYKLVSFAASDENQQAVYHTNVIMCLGEDFAVICLDSIKNNEERKKVIAELKATNKKIIEITLEQVNQFAGNMLQIRNSKGEKVLTLSKQAYNSLTQYQISALENHNDHIVMGAIYTIEKYGGGSVRCMMAEVFLPSA